MCGAAKPRTVADPQRKMFSNWDQFYNFLILRQKMFPKIRAAVFEKNDPNIGSL
jgi:hypothetical protein